MKLFDFDKEKEKEFKTFGFKSPQKVVYSKQKQTGTTNIKRDKKRDALPAGKRISKTGKVYYEFRKNRTDKRGSKI